MNTIESWGGVYYGRQESVRSAGVDQSEGTWWPAGTHIVERTRLKQLLASSARWHARKALTSFFSDDVDGLLQAAVSSGTAVELIAKAYCASVSPGLLVDRSDRDSVLMIDGQSSFAARGPLYFKSITATLALQLAQHLHKNLYTGLPDPISLRVRNAATHVALVDSIELRRAIVEMCQIMDELLPLLGLDRTKFWGDRGARVATDLLNEAKTEIARIVSAKVAAAEDRLALLTSSLPPGQVAAVLMALSKRRHPSSIEHDEAQTCPVCGQRGWLVCSVERGALEIEHDDDGSAMAWVDRTAYPHLFECTVCQLELEGNELDQFPFPSEIELEPDDDPTEICDYEPDEDRFRDR